MTEMQLLALRLIQASPYNVATALYPMSEPGEEDEARRDRLAEDLKSIDLDALAERAAPPPTHQDCHDLVCNGDRHQPRGAKGVGCSCAGRDKRNAIKLAELAEGEAPPPMHEGEIFPCLESMEAFQRGLEKGRREAQAPQPPRCEGRYPVLMKRDEPFPVTYRCALSAGHLGACGDGNADRSQPISEAQIDRLQPVQGEAQATRIAQLEAAIRWALGEEGTFGEEPAPIAGIIRRRYWWRSELRRRAFDPPVLEGEPQPIEKETKK